MIRKAAIACMGGFLLAGCASTGISTDSHGVGPTPAASFVLAGDGAAEAAVDARLRAWGMTRAAPGAAANYLVDVAFSARPRSVGAFTGVAPPDEARPGAARASSWLVQPSKRWWMSDKARICTLAVRVSEPDAHEVYRAAAWMRAPRAGCDGAADGLAQAALSEIPLRAPAHR